MPDTSPDMFCTRQDCELLLSAEGVELRTDDDQAACDDCIQEATAWIKSVLALVYAPQGLAAAPVIKYVCRFMACCNLFNRRGESIPDGWKDKAAKYDKLLESIANGTVKLAATPALPGGVAVSNQELDPERYPQLGVARARSTNIRNPAQRRINGGYTYGGFGGAFG